MVVIEVLMLVLLVLGILAGLHAFKLIKSRSWSRAVPTMLLTAALILMVVDNRRDFPFLEFGLDRVWKPRAERTSSSRQCTSMAHSAIRLVNSAGEEADADPVLVRCPDQTIVNDGGSGPASLVKEQTCWPADQAGTMRAALCYRIAFLEFNRRGELLDDDQLARLEKMIQASHALGPGREVYLVAYVHGWRHDARVGDGDVRRLRVTSSYAAAALQQRCRVAREHCGAVVIGVFVGWPGRTSVDGPGWIGQALAVPSFPRRKRVADAVGKGILEKLKAIDAVVHQDGGGASLLLGHSLGGDAILTGALPLMRDGLAESATRLDRSGPDALAQDRLGLPADLVVLLNPAAEAQKLDDLRHDEARWFAARHVVGVPVTQGSRNWPSDMPPRIILIAGRCNDVVLRSSEGNDPDACDTIVEGAFWKSQRLAEWETAPLDVFGIGHLPYKKNSTDEVTLAAIRATSHYVEFNYPFALSPAWPQPTTYSGALDPRSRCFVEPHWLYCARSRGTGFDKACGAKEPSNSTRWDTGASLGAMAPDGHPLDKTLDRIADKASPGQSNVQFGYPGGGGTWRTTVQRNSPIWAADAHKSAIQSHNSVASASFICAFTKLLFDRAASPPLPGDDPDHFQQFEREDFHKRIARRPN